MSDLISRKAVYEMLHSLGGSDASDEWSNGWDKAIDSAIKELDKIPTAFDVDKVVKQLKEIAKQEDSPIYEVDKAVDAWIRLCEVIEAVKGAVKDE